MAVSFKSLLDFQAEPITQTTEVAADNEKKRWIQFFSENPLINLHKKRKELDGKTPVQYFLDQIPADTALSEEQRAHRHAILQLLINPPLSPWTKTLRLIRSVFGSPNLTFKSELKNIDQSRIQSFLSILPVSSRLPAIKEYLQTHKDKGTAFKDLIKPLSPEKLMELLRITDESNNRTFFDWMLSNLDEKAIKAIRPPKIKKDKWFELISLNNGMAIKESIQNRKYAEKIIPLLLKPLSKKQRMDLFLSGKDENHSLISDVFEQVPTSKNKTKIIESILQFFSKKEKAQLLNNRRALSLQKISLRADQKEIENIIFSDIDKEKDIQYKQPAAGFVILGRQAWVPKQTHMNDTGHDLANHPLQDDPALNFLKESSGITNQTISQNNPIQEIDEEETPHSQTNTLDFGKPFDSPEQIEQIQKTLEIFLKENYWDDATGMLKKLTPMQRIQVFQHEKGLLLRAALSLTDGKDELAFQALFSELSSTEKSTILNMTLYARIVEYPSIPDKIKNDGSMLEPKKEVSFIYKDLSDSELRKLNESGIKIKEIGFSLFNLIINRFTKEFSKNLLDQLTKKEIDFLLKSGTDEKILKSFLKEDNFEIFLLILEKLPEKEQGKLLNAKFINKTFFEHFLDQKNLEKINAIISKLSGKSKTYLIKENHIILQKIIKLNNDKNNLLSNFYDQINLCHYNAIFRKQDLFVSLNNILDFRQIQSLLSQFSSDEKFQLLNDEEGIVLAAAIRRHDAETSLPLLLQGLTGTQLYALIKKDSNKVNKDICKKIPLKIMGMILRTFSAQQKMDYLQSPDVLSTLLSRDDGNIASELFRELTKDQMESLKDHEEFYQAIEEASIPSLISLIQQFSESEINIFSVEFIDSILKRQNLSETIPLFFDQLPFNAQSKLLADRIAYSEKHPVKHMLNEMNSYQIVEFIKNFQFTKNRGTINNFHDYIESHYRDSDTILDIFSRLYSHQKIDILLRYPTVDYTHSVLNTLLEKVNEGLMVAEYIVNIIKTLDPDERFELLTDRDGLALETIMRSDSDYLLNAFIKDLPQSKKTELRKLAQKKGYDNQETLGPILDRNFQIGDIYKKARHVGPGYRNRDDLNTDDNPSLAASPQPRTATRTLLGKKTSY